jgi:branched-chain amino acid transport system ATP-binding protein
MSGLDVHEVTVSFGGRRALDRVALDAPAGTVTGLIGPNGAGKTTLFNVICGLEAPTSGRVAIDGTDVTTLAPFKRARLGLARTFQRLELFGLLTVRENVRLAATAARREHPDDVADGLLDRLGLAGEAHQRADRLPTGRARLVELGRALATDPRVLLLDEPASGQDGAETLAFSRLLGEVASAGVAVVLVEHDVQRVRQVSRRIHVLPPGRVHASGTPAEVRAHDAVVAASLGASL